MKLLLALILAVLAALAVAGCGDDDAPPSSTPTDVNGETPTPDLSFKAQSREALRAYLNSDGLDGQTGQLTSPAECAQLAGNEVEGDYCIIEPSVYAPALALILVADADDPDNEVWQVRVVLEDGQWEVTEAVKLGDE